MQTDIAAAVRDVLVDTLDLQEDPAALRPESPLLGALPELDSFGVVALVGALEERFDIVIEDDEFGAELFSTLGTLTDFVSGKLGVSDPTN